MKISVSLKLLSVFGRGIAEAYQKLREAVNLPKSVVDLVSTALSEFDKKESEFRVSATLLSEILQPALDEANRQAGEAIGAAKKVLRVKASEKWSPVWSECGFPMNSTRTPWKLEERVALLEKLGKFFNKRSAWENEDYGVTAAIFTQRAAALKGASDAKRAQDLKHKELSKERLTLAARLRTRLSNLIKEVKHVLAPDDIRWEAFGLESPAGERTASSKEAKTQKAKAKSAAATTQKLDVAHRQLRLVRIKSEKLRSRVQRAQAAVDATQREADKVALEVAKAEAKVEALTAAAETGTVSLRPVTPAVRTQPTTPIESDSTAIALTA